MHIDIARLVSYFLPNKYKLFLITHIERIHCFKPNGQFIKQLYLQNQIYYHENPQFQKLTKIQ